jgi:hypothetical protein
MLNVKCKVDLLSVVLLNVVMLSVVAAYSAPSINPYLHTIMKQHLF